MSAPRVLIVEDDEVIARHVRAAFDSEGFVVSCAETARVATILMDQDRPDVVLLDLGLPDADGVDLCRAMRTLDPSIGIVVITARTTTIDAVVGLEAGADDYVRKPFALAELVARVRALLRRPVGGDDVPSELIAVGDVVVDLHSRRVCHGDGEIDMPRKEFDLFALLAANSGVALSRQAIMSQVWDERWFGSTKTLDMHISTLRRKLEPTAVRITTLRKVGYRLDV
jgi:DNA-binding response OmpR family regulator